MIKVLSLFDGIAGARQALKNLNIDCEYYACEIDNFAIQVAESNHWDIKYFGMYRDVNDLLSDEWENCTKEIQEIVGYLKQKQLLLENKIDLLIGGSPCQDLSISKRNRQNLDGKRSNLFFDYVRILKKVKPKFFIFENVASMANDVKNEITSHLFGIDPILINSSLLTAQQRKRLYWCGALQEDSSYKKVEISQPEDKGILLKDILESGDTEKLKSYCITATYFKACPKDYFEHGQRQLVFKKPVRVGHFNKGGKGDRIYSSNGKSVCLSANGGGRGAKTGLYEIKDLVRKLTPTECARLQGFPDLYHDGISNTQAYKCYGNSFTVPVIEHLLKHIFKV